MNTKMIGNRVVIDFDNGAHLKSGSVTDLLLFMLLTKEENDSIKITSGEAIKDYSELIAFINTQRNAQFEKLQWNNSRFRWSKARYDKSYKKAISKFDRFLELLTD